MERELDLIQMLTATMKHFAEEKKEIIKQKDKEIKEIDLAIVRCAKMIVDAQKRCDMWGDQFKRFCHLRVRVPVTQEEKNECREDPITTNKIKTIVAAWRKDVKVHLDVEHVINGLIGAYGPPVNDKEWPMIKVFGSDEAAEDWDANHT
jgi:hypothetical protein